MMNSKNKIVLFRKIIESDRSHLCIIEENLAKLFLSQKVDWMIPEICWRHEHNEQNTIIWDRILVTILVELTYIISWKITSQIGQSWISIDVWLIKYPWFKERHAENRSIIIASYSWIMNESWIIFHETRNILDLFPNSWTKFWHIVKCTSITSVKFTDKA